MKFKMAKNLAKCYSEHTQKHQLQISCTGPKKAVKRHYSAEQTDKKYVNGNGPVKIKQNQSISIKKTVVDDDLDEVLISKKKKEMYTNVQSNDLESMLFNKARKKENIRHQLDIQLNRRPIKSRGNLFHKNSMDQLKAACYNQDDHLNQSEKKKQNLNKLSKKSLIGGMDELIVKTKKESVTTEQPKGLEQMLVKGSRQKKNKEKIKNILDAQTIRRPIITSGSSLRQKMMDKLKAARFRYLNEKLYMSESKEAKELFSSDPTAFQVYHDGFQQQIKKWPISPLEIIIKKISKMPKNTIVADLGCGEGMLAKRVPQKVRSFDLVSMAEGVEVSDMAHTPLLAGEVDVAVYCLALMGTNLKEYFVEANRILKVGGVMKIAEVESRFQDVNYFTKAVESYGFKVTHVDDTHKLFLFFDFKKLRDLGSKRNKLPMITLNPCLYKKR